ncbi:hypothetical protein J9A77_28045, partial [Klebsiella pneumoniae]
SELPVMSESGQVWKGDEIQEAKEHMIDRANDPQNVFDDKGKENKKVTQKKKKKKKKKKKRGGGGGGVWEKKRGGGNPRGGGKKRF